MKVKYFTPIPRTRAILLYSMPKIISCITKSNLTLLSYEYSIVGKLQTKPHGAYNDVQPRENFKIYRVLQTSVKHLV